MILMGEGIKRLSPEFIGRHSEVPWHKVIGMRDRLAHSFDAIRFDLIWNVVQHEGPALLSDLDRIIALESTL